MGHIRAAHVHDGPVGAHSAIQLQVAHGAGAAPAPSMPLGFIVPNHALRRTAYGVAASTPGVRIVPGAQVHRVATLPTHAESITPTLPPPARPASACAHRWWWQPTAAFSATRRQLGIGAQMTDFGRTVIVCRMRHTGPTQTPPTNALPRTHPRGAALPDDDDAGHPQCSVVVAAQAADAARLMALEPAAFTAEVQAQFQHRLGDMG